MFYCCFVTPLSKVRGRVEHSQTGLTHHISNIPVVTQESLVQRLSLVTYSLIGSCLFFTDKVDCRDIECGSLLKTVMGPVEF